MLNALQSNRQAVPDYQHHLNSYTDFSGLNALKNQAGQNRETAIDAVAKQFESLYVSMMIKSMRDANKVFSEDGLLSSRETEFYQEMFDSQLAVTLSQSGGLGLSEVIKRQLGGAIESARSPSAYSMESYERRVFPKRFEPEEVIETLEQVSAAIDSSTQPTDPIEPSAIDFSSPDQFVTSLKPMALEVEAQTGISATLLIAQAALETGWGRHQIQHADGRSAHNLFGIKAHRDWYGEVAQITTTEYRDGIPMQETALFRSYDSYAESFEDYVAFLKSNPRYDDAFELIDQPAAFAKALQSSGYATDPRYSEKIINIIGRLERGEP